jgi:hypothetical protein
LKSHVLKTWSGGDEIGVVLRHDVDVGDARSTAALCAVEARLNIVSSVHILVDDLIYPAKSMASLGRELNQAGFDIGLHTQAWMHDNYMEAFHADISRFCEVMHFAPLTMTLHGAWPRRKRDLVRRRWFLRKLPELMEETGLLGYNNDFDWVSEDSNIDGRPSPVHESFMQPESYCYLGGMALILTHDAHWEPDTV